MDERALSLAGSLVTPRYIDAGAEALRTHHRTLRSLLAQRRCPEEGLSDELIEHLLLQFSLMDTNNFPGHVGGGEREGRVLNALVRRRVYGMTHGIGRSGDLNADQPKAAGSSLLYQLTNAVMLDLVRLAGAESTMAAAVVPMATGMTLSLVLRAMVGGARAPRHACRSSSRSKEGGEGDGQQRNAQDTTQDRPTEKEKKSESITPRYVVWPRIDQKTCLKCIEAAGLEPWVVPLRPVSAARHWTEGRPDTPAVSFLQVHVDDVRAAISAAGGPASVACVLSTTSCFAPRLPDDTVAIARLCEELAVPYVVNNAYGLQSRPLMRRLDAAQRLGRVDAFVQSGDKNFLVPVGGAVVCARRPETLARILALYAGRASAAPAVDLLTTALSLGRRGMQQLWSDRYARRAELQRALQQFAARRGEQLLCEEADEAGGSGAGVKKGERDNDDNDNDNDNDNVNDERLKSDEASDSRRRPARPHRRPAGPCNDISFCITMRHYAKSIDREGSEAAEHDTLVAQCKAATALGAKLFRSGVTGPRVLIPSLGGTVTIAGCHFQNYGMHRDDSSSSSGSDTATALCPLLVVACGIGMTQAEVTGLMDRLEALWPARPA